jgi:hypothetical protein
MLQLRALLSMYTYSLMLFVVDNLRNFQTNSSVHEIDTRYTNHLHIHSVTIAAIQRGTIHSAGKIMNCHLESQDLKIIRQFSSLFWGNIFLHIFYSIE